MDTNNSRGLSIAYPRFTDFAQPTQTAPRTTTLVSIAYPRFTDFAPQSWRSVGKYLGFQSPIRDSLTSHDPHCLDRFRNQKVSIAYPRFTDFALDGVVFGEQSTEFQSPIRDSLTSHELPRFWVEGAS